MSKLLGPLGLLRRRIPVCVSTLGMSAVALSTQLVDTGRSSWNIGTYLRNQNVSEDACMTAAWVCLLAGASLLLGGMIWNIVAAVRERRRGLIRLP